MQIAFLTFNLGLLQIDFVFIFVSEAVISLDTEGVRTENRQGDKKPFQYGVDKVTPKSSNHEQNFRFWANICEFCSDNVFLQIG